MRDVVCEDIGIIFMASIGILSTGILIIWIFWKLMDLAYFLGRVKALMDDGLESKIEDLEELLEKNKKR